MQFQNLLRGWLRAALSACALFALSTLTARADLLDEASIRAEGDDAVLRVSFAARVQYLAHAPIGTADLIEIAFVIVSNNAQQTAVQEYRRLSVGNLPEVTVTYPVQLTAQTKQLRVHFAKPVRFRVRPGAGGQSIEIVIIGAAKDLAVSRPPAAPSVPVPAPIAVPAPAAPAPIPVPAPVAKPPTPTAPPTAAPTPAPPAAEQQFAITLQTFPTSDMRSARPVPSQFQNYTVFTTQTVRDGKTEYELNLGYFPTQQAAEQARRALAGRFPDARVLDLAQRREETLRAQAPPPPAPARPPEAPKETIALPKPVPAPVPAPVKPPPPGIAAPVVPTDVDLDRRAAELMTKSRDALAANNSDAATELLNQLLVLPPNRYSQEAQELIGVARERSGELAKAKAEYELYLRLYPQGEGAQRVRERLANLDSVLAGAPSGGPALVERAPLRSLSGSISQYYYGGRSQTQSAFNTPVGPNQQTLSSTDISSLVSSADLNYRYRTSESDTRLVVRDTYTWSFLDTIGSFNRLDAAYAEYRGLQNPLFGRAGRQVGLSGGVPARFDGVLGGFSVAPKWRVNVVGGSPVEYPTINSSRYFYGLNVDFENLADSWTGNLYALNAMVDGILDRRAVGSEVRYFKGGFSVYTLLDYDVSYDRLNIGMVQGTWQTAGQTIFNVLYDHRRAPTLSTTNAVLGQSTSSIKELLQTNTEQQLRDSAVAVTAIANQALLGFTTPVNPNWQVGLDARLTNVGALPGTTINNIPIPPQPATGNIWSYAGQVTGSRLYSTRDINVFSFTYLTSPTFHGELYSYNNVSVVKEDWTVQPMLRYYTQTDTSDNKLNRWSPGLRLGYRWRQNIALEAEYDFEKSHQTGPQGTDDTTRHFWYLGYRYDI